MADEMNDFNAAVIEEFRGNGGKVGGPFEGADLVLVHHFGARTGTERIAPLMPQRSDSRLFVFASKAGAPDNPDWYHNLMANPEVTVEVAVDGSVNTRQVRAVELLGAERDEVWERQKAEVPQFAEYEASTDRVIPVVELVGR